MVRSRRRFATVRSFAASGTTRARLSAQASLARIVESAWSRTRSIPRTRSGSSAHSFLSRPNSRSTEARPRDVVARAAADDAVARAAADDVVARALLAGLAREGALGRWRADRLHPLLGGVGRTGTAVGCRLIETERLSGQRALDRIELLRRRTQRAHRRPPETPPSETWSSPGTRPPSGTGPDPAGSPGDLSGRPRVARNRGARS